MCNKWNAKVYELIMCIESNPNLDWLLQFLLLHRLSFHILIICSRMVETSCSEYAGICCAYWIIQLLSLCGKLRNKIVLLSTRQKLHWHEKKYLIWGTFLSTIILAKNWPSVRGNSVAKTTTYSPGAAVNWRAFSWSAMHGADLTGIMRPKKVWSIGVVASCSSNLKKKKY